MKIKKRMVSTIFSVGFLITIYTTNIIMMQI